MKKIWLYIFSFILSLILTACDNGDKGLLDTPDGWDYQAVSLVVTPNSAQIPIGLSLQLEANALLGSGQTINITKNPHLTWTSLDESIATVDDQGRVKGITNGTVTVKAEGINNDGSKVSDTAEITVTNAVVERIQVTPTVDSVPLGLTKKFVALAFLSDKTSLDVTNDPAITWSSSDTSIASITTGLINGNGIAKGNDTGSVTIKALGNTNGESFEGSAELTVTNAVIDKLEVIPNNANTPVGVSKQFTAKVTLTDGVTVIDVTNDPAITWVSSDPEIASVKTGMTDNTNGLSTGKKIGSATITATGEVNGVTYSANSQLNVTDAIITELQITPTTESSPVGLSKAFTAIAKLSDSSTIDVTNDSNISWVSSDPSIAVVTSGQTSDNGVAKGLTKGSVTITATAISKDYPKVQGDATLTITDAIISSIVVTPKFESVAKGITQQFTATAYLSDGISAIDVTTDPSINWTTDNAAVSVDKFGLSKGENIGAANVIATTTTAEGKTLSDYGVLKVTPAEIVSLQITPPIINVPIGLDKQFSATAIMTDYSTVDVTNNAAVSWTSSDEAIAKITSGKITGNGLSHGFSAGTVTITAAGSVGSSSLTGTATLNITDAEPQSLSLTPVNAVIAKGLDKQFKAEITLSDGSVKDVTNDSRSSWVSSDTDIATISSAQATNNGLAHGVKTGSATITVKGTYGGIALEQSTILTVSPAEISTIEITPHPASIAKGRNQQFTAIATLSDNSKVDITTDSKTSWTSEDIATSVISTSGSDKGIAHGINIGTTVIKATNSGIIAKADLTVTDALLESIDVTPTPLDVGLGSTRTNRFTAIGNYSDGTRPDITNLVDWTGQDVTIATVESGLANGGMVTGVTLGTTTTIASMLDAEGITITSAPATINVNKSLIEILISPVDISLIGDETAQLYATGSYDDLTTSDITDQVTWNVVDPTIAEVSQGTSGGVVTNNSLSEGRTAVSAELQGVVSNYISINTCNTLAGACIDIYDDGSGKLYTNNPSVKYLDSIGGSPNSGINVEPDSPYTVAGGFYLFNWEQSEDLCKTYNVHRLANRNNWRVAELKELQDLLSINSNMHDAQGWPVDYVTVSATEASEGNHFGLFLGIGKSGTYGSDAAVYTTCVSD
ncbi:TPA: Ig-like domain-containing protein [Photobacterium damselae]